MLLENYSAGGGASVSHVMSDTALLLKTINAWNRTILEKSLSLSLS